VSLGCCCYDLIFPLIWHCSCLSFFTMSDVPPPRPFLVCPCGFEAEFLAPLRRHQFGIHGGILGHNTQLPRRRLSLSSTVEHGAIGGGHGGVGAGAGTDGNVADDESDAAPSSAHSCTSGASASLPTSEESGSTAHSAVESQLRTLMELTRILVPNTETGAAAANAVPEYLYSSVGLHVRALYEALGDAQRAEPLVRPRKRAKTGRFNTVRLRALQRFVLQVGGAGLSVKDQEFMYNFLDVWDGIKAGMAEDAGHHATLRHVFPSVTAFKNALRDDLDNAALDAGWKKVKLVEGGVAYEAYFRDVLQVIRALLKRKRGSIQLWSGLTGPAPSSDKRETPMDGDAFRLCEELVMKNSEELACVLGLHVFSDSSQLSWSGGTFTATLLGGSLFAAHRALVGNM